MTAATIKRYHYPSQQQLKEHLCLFLKAYDFAKRLKMLRGLTPYEKIIKCWKNEPDRFINNPNYHTLGLNSATTQKGASLRAVLADGLLFQPKMTESPFDEG